MQIVSGNLFNNVDSNVDSNPDEIIEELLSQKSSSTRIERIISEGQISPPNFWYDQDENEYVAVLQGCAEIEFEKNFSLALNLGDWIIIPEHVRHKVIFTSTNPKCIWLAVFWKS